jgi:predicted ribosomally synthesized six-cysteine peptide SCIFF
LPKHIRTLLAPAMQESVKYAGCTDCAVSCQSACKTSCTVGNIVCSVTSLVNPAVGEKPVHDISRH